MTVTIDVKVLEEMERKIECLSKELKELRKPVVNNFEKLDTDVFLTEAYN
ncbi:hypothetical protein AWH56_010420 [Anaerobacillus isosaccharinicus]|uniref:Uncharacterized protein n=1 Tax=Anaerobacillus isosaccharinicus TaxID=1532552 RepID=A0A7S7RDC5_9BACI|nr:hypothetical protein [Anaerobacillus isosaccharinicus]MBA5588654.1 hypothetical protein [Anaerobacillus isosaccharinicus]QOY37939.1 hypothetical protein AWH56_010420 [Anaerobacillus isosaccharinicus]